MPKQGSSNSTGGGRAGARESRRISQDRSQHPGRVRQVPVSGQAVILQSSCMPLDVKLAYAGIYDDFANLEVQRLDERMTWLALAEFDGAETLDNNNLMRLQGLITRARWRAYNIRLGSANVEEVAKDMGIKPGHEDVFSQADVAPLCEQILPTAAAGN